jgi:ubiquinone/menaquinone biosynthesis C-methylase UbiE
MANGSGPDVKSEAPQAAEFAEHYGVPLDQAQSYLEQMDALDAVEQRCLAGIFAEVQGPVVELGAGNGEFTQELLERYLKPGQKLYALERLDTAANKLREKLKDGRVEVLQSDSASIPLPDGAAAMVLSRVALHDFVSDDGDIARALRDCVRVLAPGGIFMVYDKITDGFGDVERESAEGRMERVNVQLAGLEGKRCWGLHRLKDYTALLQHLGLLEIRHEVLQRPDMPGYITHLNKGLEQARPSYIKRWGQGVNAVLDSLYADLAHTPNKALPLAIVWGRKS